MKDPSLINHRLLQAILERLNSLIILKAFLFICKIESNGLKFVNYLRCDVSDQIIGSKQRKITPFFSACTKNSNQDSQHLNSNQKPSETSEISTVTIPSPLAPSEIPGLAKISNTSVEISQKNVLQSLDKQKIREFLMKHCPGLIIEDVMCNEAFIKCLSCSVENITSYKKQKEIYQDKAKRQKPTTELSKKNEISR